MPGPGVPGRSCGLGGSTVFSTTGLPVSSSSSARSRSISAWPWPCPRHFLDRVAGRRPRLGLCAESIERESDMGGHGRAVGEVAFGRRLQIRDGRPGVEVRDDEPAGQARVGAGGADDLDGGLGMLGNFGQAVELAAHDLAAAGGPVQDTLVQHAPQLGRSSTAWRASAATCSSRSSRLPSGRALARA